MTGLPMQFDLKTIRQLGRITDRMNLIRKNPRWYEIDHADLAELGTAASRIEEILARIKTIRAG